MQKSILDTVETNPAIKPKASIIWLHGLGADGHDFVDIVPQLSLPAEYAVRFVFPHAPIRPVTINGGFKMRAWFDFYGLTPDAPPDEIGIYNSQQALKQLIDHELTLGIPSHKIVLAGFSQGGAMALHCGLRYTQKLAGILVLSGFLPLADKLATEINVNNQNTPILMTHGQYDDVLPIKWAEQSFDHLKNLALHPKWLSYPMSHQVCSNQIHDIASWLQNILA